MKEKEKALRGGKALMRRGLAMLLVLSLCLCGLPVYSTGGKGEVEAASSDSMISSYYSLLEGTYTENELDQMLSVLMAGGMTELDALIDIYAYRGEGVQLFLDTINEYSTDELLEMHEYLMDLSSKAYSLGTGAWGIPCAVRTVRLKNKLESVMSEIITNSMTEYEKVYAIAEWMSENMSYLTTAGADFSDEFNVYGNGSAYSAFFSGGGVCGSFSSTFSVMCAYVGIDTYYIGSYNHAWNVVKVDGEWYFADPTYFPSVMNSYSANGRLLYGLDSAACILPSKSYVPKSAYQEYYDLVTGNGYYYSNTSCNGSHNFEYSAEHEASCQDGYIIYICYDCGCIHAEKVDATCDHTWDSGTYTNPTCATDGYTTYTCTTCMTGYAATKVVVDEGSATGAHSYVATVTKTASCTTAGTMTYTCSVCGDTYTETIAATGHSYTSKVTTAPTASTAGVRTYTCSTCGNTYTEAIAATGDYIDISECTAVLSETESVYDGTYKHGSLTLKVTYGGTTLTGGTDYKWSCPSIRTPGVYEIVITGMGNYTGTAYAYYTVYKADQSLSLSTDSLTLTEGESATVTATVTVDAKISTTSKVTALSSDLSVASLETTAVSVTSSTNTRVATVTVTGEDEGTAEITVYAPGNDYYNEASKTITVTVEQPPRTDISGATVTLGTSTYTYDGTAKKPSVTVKVSGTTLTEGTDYSVSYYGNTDAGTATVTITGEGDYIGTVTKTFTINKASQVVTIAGKTEYTAGDSVSLSASASGGGTITWDYGGLLSAVASGTAGTYTVTATAAATDNYLSASASVTVTVTAAAAEAVSISGATVTLGTSSYTYDGTAKTPSVTVKLSGTTLTQGTDYTVKYTGNTNAGTAIVTVTGCGDYTGTVSKTFTISKASQTVSVGSTSASLTVGGTAVITATASAGGTLSYASSDTSVATVSSTGTITGVSAGTATITVTAAATTNYNAATKTISVTVSRNAQTLTVSPSSASIAVGGTQALTVSGAKTTLSYASSDTSVATVSSTGTITGVSAGTATITVTAAATTNYNAATKTISVTVSRNAQTLTVSPSSVSIAVGGTQALTVSGAKTTLSYKSSDTSVATVSSTGTITGVSAGTATITVTAAQTGTYASATKTVSVTVGRASQSITVGSTSVGIKAGKTSTITVSGAKTALSYKSSDTSVATVSSSGKITAVSAGTAVITVTAAQTDTYAAATATVKVTVTRNTQTLTVSPSPVSLANGKTKTLSVSGASTTLSYKSSDTSVATVNSSGKITAKAVGTAAITITAAQTGQYTKAAVTVTVTVKPAATTISSVKNTTSGVKVTWEKVDGATKYYVYRKVSGGSYESVKTISSGSTVSWTDTSVSSGKTYYYKVYAYASTGKSSASAAKSIRYLTAGKISSLTNTSTGITVKWTKVSGVSGYYIYRKASGGSYTKVDTVSSSKTSYTDTGVKSKNGTTYYYYVKPYYKSGSTEYTGSYTAKTTVRLTAVSISSATNSASKKLTVKWGKNTKATGYQIEYATNSSFSGSKTITVTGASTASRTISSLTKGKTYYVRVRAYKTVSGTKYYSAWSAKKSVKVSK